MTGEARRAEGIRYRPEIDGLRAFAVVAVVLFHMAPRLLPGGFLGVDVFFVISGFLITSILQRELAAGTFRFRDFWARRIRRILPALTLVAACTLAASFVLVFGPEQRAVGKQAVAALLSFANIYFWREAGDYWGAEAEASPFLHTWSLSVEEQFYLVFPLALWLAFRMRSRWIPVGVAAVVVLSLAIFLWGARAFPTATFYLLPMRAWEIGAGSLLAVTLRGRIPQTPLNGALAVAGLGLILTSYSFVDTLGAGAVLAVLGSILVIAFGRTGPCAWILSRPSIVHTGRVSYSLYLWHWPVLVFAEPMGVSGMGGMAVLTLAIVALAHGSYVLVERPLRSRRGATPWILVAMFVVAATTALRPGYYDSDGFNVPTYYQDTYSVQPGSSKRFSKRHRGVHNPPRQGSETAYHESGITVGAADGPPRVVVLGDSLGVMWSNTIRGAVERLDVQASLWSAAGAPPFLELPLDPSRAEALGFATPRERFEFDRARMEAIERWEPDVVVLCAAWSRRQKEEEADELMEFLERHAGTVLLMEQPPLVLGVGRHNALQYLIWKGLVPDEGTRQYLLTGADRRDDVDRGSRFVERLLKRHQRASLLPIRDLFLKGDQALVLDGADAVYLDSLHLTEFGANLASVRIADALRAALSRERDKE